MHTDDATSGSATFVMVGTNVNNTTWGILTVHAHEVQPAKALDVALAVNVGVEQLWLGHRDITEVTAKQRPAIL